MKENLLETLNLNVPKIVHKNRTAFTTYRRLSLNNHPRVGITSSYNHCTLRCIQYKSYAWLIYIRVQSPLLLQAVLFYQPKLVKLISEKFSITTKVCLFTIKQMFLYLASQQKVSFFSITTKVCLFSIPA